MFSAFGMLYGKVANLRNSLYEKGVFKSYSLGVKTISVGNITTGGTGKTPLVAHVAETLATRSEKVCILTRGYGRKKPNKRVLVSDGSNVFADAEKAGDEPLELAKRLIGKASVVADANRVAAGRWAKEKFGITAFVLDDGFQHRKVKRDLDIVCIDGSNPFGSGKMLPVGILREPLANLQRADVIVITRANLAKDIGILRETLKAINPNATIFQSKTLLERIVSLKDFQNGELVPASVKEKAFAFCGLGNPADFINTVSEVFDLRGKMTFRDHYKYTKKDIEMIEQQAGTVGANVLVTTGKDAVKLRKEESRLPCFVAVTGISFDDEQGFCKLL